MRRRQGPFLLIAAGVLALLGAAGWAGLARQPFQPGEVAVPDAIAGLPLREKTVGSDAVAEVSGLHGKEFPLISGAVAAYGASGEFTLWVTGAASESSATEITAAMTDKIAAGGSPFTPMGRRQLGASTVYELDGMGQRHFYFQADSLVVWLAAEERLAEAALAELVGFYQ
jgi:hypothetical protein